MKRKRKKKLKIKNLLFVLLTLLLIGFLIIFVFGKSRDENGEEYEPEPEPPRLQIFDEDSKSRPIAIMINNNHAAWPHSGLQDAFILYEIIVEGGITRFLALYKDQDTARIGSVRSARHYFLDYALENDAFFVHHGWSVEARRDISSLGIHNIHIGANNGAWRDTSLGKSLEHTLFTSIERIKPLMSRNNRRTETNINNLLSYSVELICLSNMAEAKEANVVDIVYSGAQTTRFEFDSVNRVYRRSMSRRGTMTRHVDATTGEQYTVKNIITYKVRNRSIGRGGVQTLDNVGNGTGYFITNGFAVPITWEKPSRGAQTIYRHLNGERIQVNDGNTHIQIQPATQRLEIK